MGWSNLTKMERRKKTSPTVELARFWSSVQYSLPESRIKNI